MHTSVWRLASSRQRCYNFSDVVIAQVVVSCLPPVCTYDYTYGLTWPVLFGTSPSGNSFSALFAQRQDHRCC